MPVIVAPPGNTSYWIPLAARRIEYKSTWAGNWTLLPYFWPLNDSEDVLPAISSAQITRWLGEVFESGMTESTTFLPLDLRDNYIRIRTQVYGYQPVTQWVGIVAETSFDIDGVSAGDSQNVQAYGLAHLFNRIPLTKSWTKEGGTEYQVDDLITFNKRHQKGYTLAGNRSTSKSAMGCYMFSSDGETWTHRDIVEYYLKTAVPEAIPFSLGGAAAQESTVQLYGGSLAQMKDEHQQSGTAWSMICKMIDRRQGLVGQIVVDDADKATLFVDTITDVPISFGTKTLEANSNQVTFSFPTTGVGAHLVDPVDMRFTTAARYDRIAVESEPMVVVGTISYLDGTVARGWTTALEVAYEQSGTADPDIADLKRAAYRFEAVYQRHIVPPNFGFRTGPGDGTSGTAETASFASLIPRPKDDGTFDENAVADTWRFNKTFDRILPLLKGVKYEEDGAALNPGSHTDNDPDTEAEYRPMLVVVYDAYQGQMHVAGNNWKRIDKLGDLHSGLQNLSASPLDKELGFKVEASPNHYIAGTGFARNPGVIESRVSPEIDYGYFAATVAMTTDVRARIVKKMSQATENSKTLTIQVRGAQFWYAAKNTIVDAQNGALVRIHDNNRWLRRDIEAMQQHMAFAAAHFGVERQCVTIPIKQLGLFVPLCSYLKSISSMYAPYQIGTVVTSRKRDYVSDVTRIVTGWGNVDSPIDPVMFDRKSPMRKARR